MLTLFSAKFYRIYSEHICDMYLHQLNKIKWCHVRYTWTVLVTVAD